MAVNYVPEDHLYLFLCCLSKWIGYPFAEWDWDAIRFGLPDTSETTERWYDYALMGTPPILLAFAHASDAASIALRYDAEEPMLSRIDFLVRILQNYHPRQGTVELEDLIARAFSTVTVFDANRVLACNETHLAVCSECQEAQRTFQGKSWTELVVATDRPPRYFAGLGFLRPEARQFFFPAYLIAALRDKDAEWLEIARSAGISENSFTVSQRDLIEFVVQRANQEEALLGEKCGFDF